jgi:hypothetical protein
MAITDNGSLIVGTPSTPNSLFGLGEMVNSNRNPRGNVGFIDLKWTGKHAREVEGFTCNDHMAELAAFVRANKGPVEAEIERLMAFKRMDPYSYAQAITLFGLLSPSTDFDENIEAAQKIFKHLYEIEDAGDIPPLLEVHRWGDGRVAPINYWQTKALAIWRALPFLREIEPERMTLDRIKDIWGAGPKVAAFITALWDPTTQVFTLDSWMARLTHKLKGLYERIKAAFSWPGYRLTEAEWLAWRREALPDVAPFTAQWTLWDGVRGWHESHLGILPT